MTTTVKSRQEFYQTFKDEVTSLAPEFVDFSPGSLLDVIAGAVSIVGNELTELIVNEFAKTYFDLAEGADLDTVIVDHFGSTFARTPAVKATGTVTFSRGNTSGGDVFIAAGTVVKTVKNSQGVEIRVVTDEDATMTGVSVTVPVTASVAGVSGNVISGKLVVLEGPLSDPSVVVTNSSPLAGGAEALTDAEYREFARAKILALAGATEAAVKGAAQSVPGVEFVYLTTQERVVIDYDIENEDIAVDALFFRIPYPVIYIADENGNSSQALIDAVKAAIHFVRACGVKIEVKGAVAYPVDWTASYTLNPSGPNYATLEDDPTMIKDSMKAYIDETLAIGSGFVRSAANAHILSIWGPSGTNDLTAFTTSVPSGDVAGAVGQKLVAGTMEIE